MGNYYASLDQLKARPRITVTADDAVLKRLLEAASRAIDRYTDRHFYVETGTRYFNSRAGSPLLVDDLLAVTSLGVDSEEDGTFDGEAWVAADYTLLPLNAWPKTMIEANDWGDYEWTRQRNAVKIVGRWGYGNGVSATPYRAAGTTVTVADGTSTTVAAVSGAAFETGQTILAGTEQMFISAISGNNLTVERGVNGTTAAAQTGAAAYIYEYPAEVTQATVELAVSMFRTLPVAGFEAEKSGDWYHQGIVSPEILLRRFVGPFRRLAV